MSMAFWGVRGSSPVVGPDHLAFGGSTMCLEVRAADHRMIVDAGTGIQQLGWAMAEGNIGNVDILLTHFHLDHIMGLMTFAPLFQKGATVTVHAPVLEEGDPAPLLHRILDRPFFPMKAGETGAAFVIKSFHPGDSFLLPGFTIRTLGLSHPGGACGYRITHQERSVSIIIDHEHESVEPESKLADFCAGTDLILYDAHWDESTDYDAHRGWGHSTWQAGLRLLQASDAVRLGCIHHAPWAIDEILQGREAALQHQHPESFFAREGQRLQL